MAAQPAWNKFPESTNKDCRGAASQGRGCSAQLSENDQVQWKGHLRPQGQQKTLTIASK